jgi:hypothetical protein
MVVGKTMAMGWALPVAALLAACGGGDGGSDGDGGGGPDLAIPTWSQRIEPFEPKSATALKGAAQAPAASPAVASAAATGVIALAALPAVLTKSAAASAGVGVPHQIGMARSVPEAADAARTAALLQWQPTARGTQVAALRFESPGARGLRLGVLVQALPTGAVLRFHGAAPEAALQISAQELQALAERNAGAGAADEVAHTYWSPDLGAAQATLEVEIPADAQPAAVRLAVPRLSHFTQTAADAEAASLTKAAAAGSCLVDVSCRPDYLEQSRSVARMTFVAQDGNAYYCSGTLLNDAASSGTPYFLSAQHCIASQAVASTLETDWLYRSASCNGADQHSGARRLRGGARLLYASASTDTAFMQLNDPAPAGIIHAGSYYGGVPIGMALAGLHHPEGAWQSISLGSVLHYGNCANESCSPNSGENGSFLAVTWQQGSTEGGSSGSGVFVTIGAQRYLAGQLHGGLASCASPSAADYYGRFDLSYRAAIKRWLNP